MTDDRLTAEELTNLVQRVFEPTDEDRALAVIIDLPDDQTPDTEAVEDPPPNSPRAGSKNLRVRGRTTVSRSRSSSTERPFKQRRSAGDRMAVDRCANCPITSTPWSVTSTNRWTACSPRTSSCIAPTRFSTTAPSKVMAPRLGFRAATMPGFSPAMVPALRLDYTEVNRRVMLLKDLLDRQHRGRLSVCRSTVRTKSGSTSTSATARRTPPEVCSRRPGQRATSHRAKPTSSPTRERLTGIPTSSKGKHAGPVRRRGRGVCDREQRRGRHHQHRS